MFSEVDWNHIFVPNTPIIEIFIRGTLMYLGLFVLLRLILKREAGGLGMSDLLVVVLLADAASNGLTDDYRSIPDGILLVLTIILWSHFLNFLGYKFSFFRKFMQPPPLLLVEDGKINFRNMKRELITKDELLAQLREQGVDELLEVKKAFMEMDGTISVICKPKNNE